MPFDKILEREEWGCDCGGSFIKVEGWRLCGGGSTSRMDEWWVCNRCGYRLFVEGETLCSAKECEA